MSNISFSLTEKFIINPVLHLRAPLGSPECYNYGYMAKQFFDSEIAARVLAVFTSVLATADTLFHLLSALCTGNRGHLKQAAVYGLLTIIGSLAGFLCPSVLEKFLYTPDSPPNNIEDIKDAPPLPAIRNTQTFWAQATLEEKHYFVLTHTNGEQHLTLRSEMSATVYRPLTKERVTWLSKTEITRSLSISDYRAEGVFCHATSQNSLGLILQSKIVKVMHEKLFRGAFASFLFPETAFGDCVLVFRRNIERLSALEHGFSVARNRYWAGFSRAIPVTETTLAYIILNRGTTEACTQLSNECETAFGSKIPVVSLNDVQPYLDGLEALNIGIPKEWPEEGEDFGNKILNTMRNRIGISAIVSLPVQQAQTLSPLQPAALLSTSSNFQITPTPTTAREQVLMAAAY